MRKVALRFKVKPKGSWEDTREILIKRGRLTLGKIEYHKNTEEIALYSKEKIKLIPRDNEFTGLHRWKRINQSFHTVEEAKIWVIRNQRKLGRVIRI